MLVYYDTMMAYKVEIKNTQLCFRINTNIYSTWDFLPFFISCSFAQIKFLPQTNFHIIISIQNSMCFLCQCKTSVTIKVYTEMSQMQHYVIFGYFQLISSCQLSLTKSNTKETLSQPHNLSSKSKVYCAQCYSWRSYHHTEKCRICPSSEWRRLHTRIGFYFVGDYRNLHILTLRNVKDL